MPPKRAPVRRKKRPAPTYERTSTYAGSLSGYHVVLEGILNGPLPPSLGNPITARFRAPWAGTWLLLFSTEERMLRGVNDADCGLCSPTRVEDGDTVLRTCRSAGVRVAIDAEFDADANQWRFIEATRDPDADPPVERVAVGAVLLDSTGLPMTILTIARATDEQLEAARRHAERRGLQLFIDPRPPTLCKTEKELVTIIRGLAS